MGFFVTAVLLWAAVGGKHHARAGVRATRRSRSREMTEQESDGFFSPEGATPGGISGSEEKLL